MNYWLMKCEPEVFSIDDLQKVTSTGWEGVRNYQARNFMKTMACGDIAFFYHSNATPSGIAGIMTISKAAFPDPFQFDTEHRYFEPRATIETPVWVTVEVTFQRRFKELISLADLKSIHGLDAMEVLKRGSRLSIQPVRKEEYSLITKWESQRQ